MSTQNAQHSALLHADTAQAREWDKQAEGQANDEWAPLTTREIARAAIQERRRKAAVQKKINLILDGFNK